MSEVKKNKNEFAAKKLARLAAVQVLYQSSYEQETLAQIIQTSIDENFPSLREEESVAMEEGILPDADLFSRIAVGVVEEMKTLDEVIVSAVDAKLSPARMEILLKTILRAGVFELYHHPEIPTGVIVNDYVDVTRAFFGSKEPGLVNAVLDKIAGKLRK